MNDGEITCPICRGNERVQISNLAVYYYNGITTYISLPIDIKVTLADNRENQ